MAWLMVLVGLLFTSIGFCIFFGIGPFKPKEDFKPGSNEMFVLRFFGVAIMIGGIEVIVNQLMFLVGQTWFDTKGLIGISILTLYFFTLAIGIMSGVRWFPTSTQSSKSWRLFAGMSLMVVVTGFFIEHFGHQFDNEQMESIGNLSNSLLVYHFY